MYVLHLIHLYKNCDAHHEYSCLIDFVWQFISFCSTTSSGLGNSIGPVEEDSSHNESFAHDFQATAPEAELFSSLSSSPSNPQHVHPWSALSYVNSRDVQVHILCQREPLLLLTASRVLFGWIISEKSFFITCVCVHAVFFLSLCRKYLFISFPVVIILNHPP